MPRLLFSGGAASASQLASASRDEHRNSAVDGTNSTSSGGRSGYFRNFLSRKHQPQTKETAPTFQLASLPPVSSSPTRRPRLRSREIIQHIQQQQQSAINFSRSHCESQKFAAVTIESASPGASNGPPVSAIIFHHHPESSNSVPLGDSRDQNQNRSVTLTPVKRRRRFNSRDISNTYAGQYGSAETDLLPFECMRIHTINPTIFLSAYVAAIAILHIIGLILQIVLVGLLSFLRHSFGDIFVINIIPFERYVVFDFAYKFLTNLRIDSWTITNAIHLVATMGYVHWAKGRNSILFLSGGISQDEQGEMNAMTLWEQLEAIPESIGIRRILLVIPTVLTYISCLACSFQHETCYLNMIFWCIGMVGKLPCMNGVRLFGINSTAGIDDDIIDYIETTSSTTSSSTFKKRFKYI